MVALVYPMLTFGGRALGRLSRTCYSLAGRWAPDDLQRRVVIASTDAYDMVGAPDEPYYAEQYGQVLRSHLERLAPAASVLDLGCGQGRLTLAAAGLVPSGQVLGCDVSPGAIRSAEGYAVERGVRNATFRVQPIAECLREAGDASFDAVLMTEVTFFYPGWRDELPRIARCLKPGGLFVLSYRPQYFYAMSAIRRREWDSADMVLREREGRVLGSETTFTWQSWPEVQSMLSDAAFDVEEACGIGTCSGIPGDPHDAISRPSALTAAERERLMRIELGLGRQIPEAGRYVLVVSRKHAGGEAAPR